MLQTAATENETTEKSNCMSLPACKSEAAKINAIDIINLNWYNKRHHTKAFNFVKSNWAELAPVAWRRISMHGFVRTTNVFVFANK